jgi:hypothetical protein
MITLIPYPFADTIDIVYTDPNDKQTKKVDLLRTNIAWDSDKKFKFKNPDLKPGETLQQGQSFFGRAGANVVITIFAYFRRKNGVFLKHQCYGPIFGKTSCSLSKKRQYFRHIFRRNILRIITSVPSLGLLYYSV